MSSYRRPAQHHAGDHVLGWGGAYSTMLRGWARTYLSSYWRPAQHHVGKHAMGRGGGPIVQRSSDGQGLICPRFGVTYEENISCTPSEIGVAGGPS